MNDMRLIDSEPLMDDCEECASIEWNKKVSPVSWADAEEEFLQRLKDAPVIDAVPVVRCKDCSLQGKLGCPMDEWVKPDDNGFCHHGKRKDGD